MSKGNWVGIYMLGGILYEFLMERNFDIFSLRFWWRVVIWIPLLAYHWIVSTIFVILAVVIGCVVLYYAMPNFRTIVDRRFGGTRS